jgi:hypothetical protein
VSYLFINSVEDFLPKLKELISLAELLSLVEATYDWLYQIFYCYMQLRNILTVLISEVWTIEVLIKEAAQTSGNNGPTSSSQHQRKTKNV